MHPHKPIELPPPCTLDTQNFSSYFFEAIVLTINLDLQLTISKFDSSLKLTLGQSSIDVTSLITKLS